MAQGRPVPTLEMFEWARESQQRPSPTQPRESRPAFPEPAQQPSPADARRPPTPTLEMFEWAREPEPGLMRAAGRGFAGAVSGLTRGTLAGGLQYVGDVFNLPGVERWGQDLAVREEAFQERMALPERIRGNPFERSELWREPTWWAHFLGSLTGNVVGFMVPAGAGARVGGMAARSLAWGRRGKAIAEAVGLAGGGATVESLAEGAFAYQDALNQGKSSAEAAEIAERVTKQNMALILATGGVAYGLPSASTRLGRRIQRAGQIALESGQEAAQEVIAGGEPEEVALGALGGGIMGAFMGPAFERLRRPGRAVVAPEPAAPARVPAAEAPRRVEPVVRPVEAAPPVVEPAPPVEAARPAEPEPVTRVTPEVSDVEVEARPEPERRPVEREAPAPPPRVERQAERRKRARVRESPADATFPAILTAARERGWTGTDEELKRLFDERIEMLTAGHEALEQAGRRPEDLFGAIAKAGGIAYDRTYPAEVEAIRQDVDLDKTGKSTGRNMLGIGGVFNRNSRKTLGDIVEALREDVRFDYIADENQFVEEFRAAARKGRKAPLPFSERELAHVAIRPGTAWWQDRYSDLDAFSPEMFEDDPGATAVEPEGEAAPPVVEPPPAVEAPAGMEAAAAAAPGRYQSLPSITRYDGVTIEVGQTVRDREGVLTPGVVGNIVADPSGFVKVLVTRPGYPEAWVTLFDINPEGPRPEEQPSLGVEAEGLARELQVPSPEIADVPFALTAPPNVRAEVQSQLSFGEAPPPETYAPNAIVRDTAGNHARIISSSPQPDGSVGLEVEWTTGAAAGRVTQESSTTLTPLAADVRTTPVERFDDRGVSGTASVGPFGGNDSPVAGSVPSRGRRLFDPDSPGAPVDQVQAVQFPEMVALLKDVQGEAPRIVRKLRRLGQLAGFSEGKIRLLAELFQKGREAELAAVLAHEIGHWKDWLPDQTLARGNLIGRLFSLDRYLRGTFSSPTGEIRNKDLKEELVRLSRLWRPWDPETAHKRFKAYRNSSRELYADAISVLLNNPGMLEREAPRFYEQLFAGFDTKPEIRDAYFELQEVLSRDPVELAARREQRIQGMWRQGNQQAKEAELRRRAEALARQRSWWFHFRTAFFSKHTATQQAVRRAEAEGEALHPEENPLFALRARNYFGAEVERWAAQEVQPIKTHLDQAGVDWNTFSSALFYNRILQGDRSEVANPDGIAPAEADQGLRNLEVVLGPERMAVVRDAMERFYAMMRRVMEEAFAAGLYTEAQRERIRTNPAYVTFRVLEYLDRRVTSTFYQQKGTLGDIQNVADASLAKALAIKRAAEWNQVTMKVVEVVQRVARDQVKPAEQYWNGQRMVFRESTDPTLRLIRWRVAGKEQGVLIDRYIADSIQNARVDAGMVRAVISIMDLLNSGYFRPIFTTWNLGFQSYNVVRDFLRVWKNTPELSLRDVLRRYWQAVPLAKVRAFGLRAKPTAAELQAWEDLQQAKGARILGLTFNQFNQGQQVEDRQIDEFLRRLNPRAYGPTDPIHPARAALRGFLDRLAQVGDFVETLPKAAAMYHFQGEGTIAEIPADVRDFIRRKVGSPDFLDGGTLTPLTNQLLLFSNAMIQGTIADVEVAVKNARQIRQAGFTREALRLTQSGWWFRTAMVDILPKMLMYGATLGLGGEWLKRILDGATEYDKTNYVVIPLGFDADGNPRYWRLPHSDSGRVVGGLTWKLLRTTSGDDVVGSLMHVFDFTAGQFPSVHPAFSVAKDTKEMLAGQNPYDAFRQRFLFTEDEHRARDWRTWRKFLGYEFQNLGGGIVWKFYPGEERPRQKSRDQTILDLPVVSNIVGRHLRVTDYGSLELMKRDQARSAREDARERVTRRELINDAVRAYQREQPDNRPASNAWLAKRAEAIADAASPSLTLRERREKAQRIERALRISVLRGRGDELADMMLSARSNAERLEILRGEADRRGAAALREWLRVAQRERVVTAEVARQALRELRGKE